MKRSPAAGVSLAEVDRDNDFPVLDRRAFIALACAAQGAVAWMLAVLLAWIPYVYGDLADILNGGGRQRTALVIAYLTAHLSALFLSATAFAFGLGAYRARRSRALAALAMASATVLVVLGIALALLTADVVRSEYATLRECARTGACINP